MSKPRPKPLVPPNSIPPIIPRELLAKADNVLVVASGSPQGTILYMANNQRVDSGAEAIDQEPFGIVFHGSAPGSGGCLVHHGSCKASRTILAGTNVEPDRPV